MGFKKKLKKLFGKSEKKDENQQPLSRNDKYGSNGKGLEFKSNPLYEESENVGFNPLYKEEEKQTPTAAEVPAAEEIAPMVNSLQIIAGMPSKKAIEEMASGLNLEKLKKHKNFQNALNALENYQKIMREPRAVTMNVAKARRHGRFAQNDTDLNIDGDAVKDAFKHLQSFVLAADKAVNSVGLFSRNSSNVQKLKPIFANLLVQAYALLPKLANLQYEISPYVMATDKEKFTYEEVLNHEVSAGRSGGLAMRSVQENNGAVVLNPQEALKALKGEKVKRGKGENEIELEGDSAEERIANLRKWETQEKRMSLQIPPLPVGFFKSQDSKQDAKTLKAQADALTDSYLTEIRLLMRALDDTAESHEGGEEDRMGVHDKQAEHFRMSKLFSHVLANRELLKDVIVNGMPKELTAECEDIFMLRYMEGMTLSEGVSILNKTAQDTSKFARLIDGEGKDLQEGTDYIVGGNNASISILDFKNGRVLRAPKEQNQYLSKEKQNTALNGINDEAVGKISQFLGLNVSAQAEAVGFKAKEKGKTEEQDVFGGSIMELVKGVEAKKLDFHMDGGKLNVSSQKDGENIDNKKLGRLLGDMMKMNVLDYIVLHGDRNTGNFMINLDAKESESMVTAIDNDKIFGNTGDKHFGHETSKEALNGINDRYMQQHGSKLSTALPMVTKEVKDLIEKIDLQAFNEMLMPYADRVSRLAAIHRVKELKAKVSSVDICDFTTEEGIQKYVHNVLQVSAVEWVKTMTMYEAGYLDGGSAVLTGNHILKQLLCGKNAAVTLYGWGPDTCDKLVKSMKSLGLSDKEIIDIIKNNLSTSKEKDEIIGEEKMKELFGSLLNLNDSLDSEVSNSNAPRAS